MAADEGLPPSAAARRDLLSNRHRAIVVSSTSDNNPVNVLFMASPIYPNAHCTTEERT